MRRSRTLAALVLLATTAGAGAAARAEGPEPATPQAVTLQNNLSPSAPLSALLHLNAGSGDEATESAVVGDLDGRENLQAEHSGRVERIASGGATLTRTAVSEHTIANGFAEDIFYYGDSVGNVTVCSRTAYAGNAASSACPTADKVVLNLPTVLNAFGDIQSDTEVAVTGLAVNPVADLTSYPNVNGAFAPFSGQIGEILYVAYNDPSGFRLASNGETIHSGVLAFPIADVVSPAAAPPAVQSPAGFPVTVGGSFGVVFSKFHNNAGLAVDDDGNVYFHMVDLDGRTGAAIAKITSVDNATNQDRSLATSGILTINTLSPTNGVFGGSSGPANQVNRTTNYSGTSTTWGNATAMAVKDAGHLLVALSASQNGTATPLGAGLFTNPTALGATPSMIVGLNDVRGATKTIGGQPAAIGDGFAENLAGVNSTKPGVDNFVAFVLGNGRDRRRAGTVFGSAAQTLKLDLNIDHGLFNGLAVDEANAVYAISGGSAGDASPDVTEVLVFPDTAPFDRRADFVDLRGDEIPEPFAADGVGDGDSDRFDHVFVTAPISSTTSKPGSMAGLSRGFLRYLNRTAVNVVTDLPNGATQGDDASNGPIYFGALDPSFTVAGGDDFNQPLRGDRLGTTGFPAAPPASSGGFEFNIGAVLPGCQTPWNAFYLGSNGYITFDTPHTDTSGSGAELVSGMAKIAPAWIDMNPAGRAVTPAVFPVQAVGFGAVNTFVIKNVNIPQFGLEAAQSANTWTLTLFDDGTGVDENSAAIEGPTSSRFVGGAATTLRPDGTSYVDVDYGFMDVHGNQGAFKVISGYSVGRQNSSGFKETNLSATTGLIGGGRSRYVVEQFDKSEYDLRTEGNRPAEANTNQVNNNRQSLSYSLPNCSI